MGTEILKRKRQPRFKTCEPLLQQRAMEIRTECGGLPISGGPAHFARLRGRRRPIRPSALFPAPWRVLFCLFELTRAFKQEVIVYRKQSPFLAKLGTFLPIHGFLDGYKLKKDLQKHNFTQCHRAFDRDRTLDNF